MSATDSTLDVGRTHLIIGAICLLIALLTALSLGDSAGQVDPPPVPEWSEIPTCSNGGRTDCGSAMS